MIRSIVLHDIPISAIAAMERWYWRDHSPEIVRRFGPWEVRHDSWLPVDAPAEARTFGFMNWRLTEGWWRELPKPGPQGNLSFTAPPVWPKVATCFLPAQPTEDFLGWEATPNDRPVLRWFVMHRYPKNVPVEQGEAWFLGTHALEVMRQKRLFRFFSSRTVPVESGLPGTWASAARPPHGSFSNDWVRVSEFWYESFDDWRLSVLDAPPAYTPPPWATDTVFPHLVPGIDFVSTFVLERPTDEFTRDARGYL